MTGDSGGLAAPGQGLELLEKTRVASERGRNGLQQLAPFSGSFATHLLPGFGPATPGPARGKGELEGPFLCVGEVARRLGVCRSTVYGLCERGELPHLRINNSIRIAPSDLAAFLTSRRSGRSGRRGV